jgi:putative transposase
MTIDGSEANAAAIQCYNEAHGTTSLMRQVQYLTTRVEPEQRAVQRVPRPRLGFTSCETAQSTPTGLELMHMSKKRQGGGVIGQEGLTAAEQFYALAS